MDQYNVVEMQTKVVQNKYKSTVPQLLWLIFNIWSNDPL